MSNKSVITSEMLKAIGVNSDPKTHNVELGSIRKFAESIGDANPIYKDEAFAASTKHKTVIAPPTFLRSLEPGPTISDLEISYEEVLDGGSVWKFIKSVAVGDQITVVTKIADLKEKEGKLGPMLFVDRETNFSDQHGDIVATELSTYIYYNPTSI